MERQALLALDATNPAQPAPEEIDRVCTFLAGKGWVKSAEIETALGVSDRKLRAVAEYSDGAILSAPGSPGYRLFDASVTVEEATACAHRHQSQAKRHQVRASAYLRRLHAMAR